MDYGYVYLFFEFIIKYVKIIFCIMLCIIFMLMYFMLYVYVIDVVNSLYCLIWYIRFSFIKWLFKFNFMFNVICV